MSTGPDWDEVAGHLASAGLTVTRDQPAAPLTTYGVGGRLACCVAVTDGSDVASLAAYVSSRPDLPVAIIGRGSNLLVADSGFDGLAIVFTLPAAGASIGIDGDHVVASGALSMPLLARRSAKAGRRGLEWCVGIPGTVGGAVRMNAGGHGAEIVDSLVSAEIASFRSGRIVRVDRDDLGLHFRGSALGSRHLVVSARFATEAGDQVEAESMINEIVAWRRANQPGGRNAGSVFVNPSPGEGSAGALIDGAGLRGHRIGGARVSEKHANFIQADDGCTADDIIGVLRHVQQTVATVSGLMLRSEVQLLGFDDEVARTFSDPRHDSPDRRASRERLGRILGESP